MKHWTKRKNFKMTAVLGMILLLCLILCVGCDESTEHTHTWKDWEVVIQPSCESKGSQERVCAECNEKEQSYITELGHDLEKQKSKRRNRKAKALSVNESIFRFVYTAPVKRLTRSLPITGRRIPAPAKKPEITSAAIIVITRPNIP